MKKKPYLFGTTLFLAMTLSACGPEGDSAAPTEEPKAKATETKAAEPADKEVRNVSAEEAKKLIEETADLVVLDVRTPEEFAEGHIKGAINIDFKAESFETEVGKLNPDVPYVIHCRSGRRSAEALTQIKPMAFQTLYHLDSGFNGWQEAGLPVEK
ncbi:MAG: rhodanese-like domain-containing protein [Verrucomicrobiales bacterium]|nr:rhodanese-like domain-containing protein [Verrucomicrobiales bacterium]